MISARETAIIDTFVGTMGGQSLDEALANAELDARAYNLSRGAARELGRRIRAAFSR